MPPRRSHTKSRTGCDQCKARRKKCDETGPPCTSCSSRKLDCSYPDNGFQHSHWSDRSQEIGKIQTESNVSTAKIPKTGPSSRMRELGLMHHWSLKTCYSFSPDMADIFQNHAVKLGMHHEFLMDSLLAFTCLHIAAGNDGLEPNYNLLLDDALQYQEKALPAFRAKLETISKSNCEALLLCSMIMMAFAAVFPCVDIGEDMGLNEPPGAIDTTGLMSMFFFAKGIHSVIDNSKPWLENSSLQAMIWLYPKEYWTSSPPEGNIFPPELRKMCNLSNVPVGPREIYDRAILMLENCSSRDERMTLAWVAEVGEAFVSLVRKKEPTALLIYVCWGALIGSSENLWWAGLAGRTIVKRIVPSFSMANEETRLVLEWAHKRLDNVETQRANTAMSESGS